MSGSPSQGQDPEIEDDDCSRHDYAVADKIVLEQLREVLGFRDLTEAGRGFIQAMVVYLLTECDWACGTPLWWGNGEDLLSDGGWRRNDIEVERMAVLRRSTAVPR